jgi:fluoride exporter
MNFADLSGEKSQITNYHQGLRESSLIFDFIYSESQYTMFRTLLLIGTGGFLGSISRYLASKFIQNNFSTAFPLGTFMVNIAGCFLIGFIYGISEKSALLTTGWKLFLAVGFCGGFTTFSAFANENLALLRDGEIFYFFIYSGLSVMLGITATFFGVLFTKIL